MTDQTTEQVVATETPDTMGDYAEDFHARQAGDTEALAPEVEKAEESAPSNVEDNNEKNDDGETNDQAEAASSEEVEKPTRQNRRAERKIGKLSKKVKERDDSIATYKARIAELEAGGTSQEPKLEKPVLEDYDSIDEFMDARDTWRDNDQEPKKTPSKSEGKQEEGNADLTAEIAKKAGVTADEVEEVRDNFQDAIADGEDEYEDFVEKTKDLSINLNLARELADADNPIDLMYHFAGNQKDLDKLLSITSERKLARAIVKLEATVSANKGTAKKVKASKASEPMPEVGASSGGGDISEQSMDTYAKVYFKRLGGA